MIAIALAIVAPSVAPAARSIGLASAAPVPRTASSGPDFNGDGFADLAIGVFGESVSGASGAGAVQVLYGSLSGLQTDGSGAPDDQFWTQDSPGVKDQAENGDGFGGSVEAGDFDGDGYADLAIAARAEDVGTVGAAGAVNVLYGSACGLQADPTCGNLDDQFWHEDSPGVKGIAESGDHCGSSLAGGDFNGDGFDDLASGCDFKIVNGHDKAGGAMVLYGSASGLQATGTGGPDDQFWTQDSPSVKETAEAGDRFGREVESTDFNGDGYEDLAISAVFESVGAVNHGGSVSVLYGSADGLQARGTGGPDDQFWTQDSPGIKDAAENDDRFGAAFTVGDFDGDGYGDLASGVRQEDIGSIVDAGSVSIIFGSAVGLQPGGPDGLDDQFISQNTPGVEDQSEEGDWMGYSMSAADYNGDGFTDLCAGSRKEDVGTVVDAGAVNVFYGSPTGLRTNGTPDDQFWNQDSVDVLDQSETGDEMAVWSGGGDFDGDGFDDLTVAVWLDDVGTIVDAGGVNVLYSSGATGLSAVDNQYWDQSSAGIAGDGPETGDQFGWVVGAT